jgi:hypothetical protein
MKKLISSSEVVESVDGDGGEWEVCAAADADYDESDSHVVVEHESFLRKASTSGDSEVRQPPWLAGKSRVTKHAPREEASQVAHDVFATWARKARHPIPPEPLKSSA